MWGSTAISVMGSIISSLFAAAVLEPAIDNIADKIHESNLRHVLAFIDIDFESDAAASYTTVATEAVTLFTTKVSDDTSEDVSFTADAVVMPTRTEPQPSSVSSNFHIANPNSSRTRPIRPSSCGRQGVRIPLVVAHASDVDASDGEVPLEFYAGDELPTVSPVSRDGGSRMAFPLLVGTAAQQDASCDHYELSSLVLSSNSQLHPSGRVSASSPRFAFHQRVPSQGFVTPSSVSRQSFRRVGNSRTDSCVSSKRTSPKCSTPVSYEVSMDGCGERGAFGKRSGSFVTAPVAAVARLRTNDIGAPELYTAATLTPCTFPAAASYRLSEAGEVSTALPSPTATQTASSPSEPDLKTVARKMGTMSPPPVHDDAAATRLSPQSLFPIFSGTLQTPMHPSAAADILDPAAPIFYPEDGRQPDASSARSPNPLAPASPVHIVFDLDLTLIKQPLEHVDVFSLGKEACRALFIDGQFFAAFCHVAASKGHYLGIASFTDRHRLASEVSSCIEVIELLDAVLPLTRSYLCNPLHVVCHSELFPSANRSRIEGGLETCDKKKNPHLARLRRNLILLEGNAVPPAVDWQHVSHLPSSRHASQDSIQLLPSAPAPAYPSAAGNGEMAGLESSTRRRLSYTSHSSLLAVCDAFSRAIASPQCHPRGAGQTPLPSAVMHLTTVPRSCSSTLLDASAAEGSPQLSVFGLTQAADSAKPPSFRPKRADACLEAPTVHLSHPPPVSLPSATDDFGGIVPPSPVAVLQGGGSFDMPESPSFAAVVRYDSAATFLSGDADPQSTLQSHLPGTVNSAALDTVDSFSLERTDGLGHQLPPIALSHPDGHLSIDSKEELGPGGKPSSAPIIVEPQRHDTHESASSDLTADAVTQRLQQMTVVLIDDNQDNVQACDRGLLFSRKRESYDSQGYFVPAVEAEGGDRSSSSPASPSEPHFECFMRAFCPGLKGFHRDWFRQQTDLQQLLGIREEEIVARMQ